jgi:hypothetical protein
VLPAASSQQPAASSQQPAASSQQPAASSQQPAASGQQPAASRKHQAAREAANQNSALVNGAVSSLLWVCIFLSHLAFNWVFNRQTAMLLLPAACACALCTANVSVGMPASLLHECNF